MSGEERLDYLVVGAGPAGTQAGYFLERAGREYLVVEAGESPGTFFRRFPRHRTMISNNKVNTGWDDPELNLLMAEALMSQHAYADAEPYLAKSLHAKPQMLPRIHALIGKAYAETGRTREAIEQLKLGESSDEDGSLQYLLVQLYRRLGDTQNASTALERMKAIKAERAARGYKRVEDPDLSPLEPGATRAPAP